MAVLKEGQRIGDWLKVEEQHLRSREEHTILAGSGSDRVLTSGMVLGEKQVTGTGTAAAFAGNTGDGVMGAITVGTLAKAGRYVLRLIAAAADAGDFVLEDPEGNNVGVGTVAVAFSGGGLSFTLADGATDFAVGDGFDIDVVITERKLVQQDLAATDGSELAFGLLALDTTAPDGVDKKAAVVVRDAVISKSQITHPTGATQAQIDQALAALALKNIIGREGA